MSRSLKLAIKSARDRKYLISNRIPLYFQYPSDFESTVVTEKSLATSGTRRPLAGSSRRKQGSRPAHSPRTNKVSGVGQPKSPLQPLERGALWQGLLE